MEQLRILAKMGDPRCVSTAVAKLATLIKDQLLAWVSGKTCPFLNRRYLCHETSREIRDIFCLLSPADFPADEVCSLARAATALITDGRSSELPRLMYSLSLPRRRAVSNHTCSADPCPLLVTVVTSKRLSPGDATRLATFLLSECGSEANVDWEGLSPLHLAVRRDNADLAEVLVEHGADCHVTWPGGTPLVYVPACLGSRQLAHALCAGLGAKHSPLVTSLCDSVTSEEADTSLPPQHHVISRASRIAQINAVELVGSYLVDTGEDSCEDFHEGVSLLTEAMHHRHLDPRDVVLKNEDVTGRRLALASQEALTPGQLEKAAASEDIFQQSQLTTRRILGNPSLLFAALVKRASHYRKTAEGKRSCFFYLRKAAQVLREESSQSVCGQSVCVQSLCGQPLCAQSLCVQAVCGQSLCVQPWLCLPWPAPEAFVTCLHWLLEEGCEDQLLWPLQEAFLSLCACVLDRAGHPGDFQKWSDTWQESCFQVVKMALSRWDDAVLPDRVREALSHVIRAEMRAHRPRCPNLLLLAVLDAAESEDNDVIGVMTELWEDVDAVVDAEDNTVLHRCLKLRPPQFRLLSVLDVAWVILQAGRVNPLPANKAGESVRDLLWELLSECAREQSKRELIKG